MVTQLAECRSLMIEFGLIIFFIFVFRKIRYAPM